MSMYNKTASSHLLPMAVEVKKQPAGDALKRMPVGLADFHECFSEVWLHGYLRKGFPDFPLDEMVVELTPSFKRGNRGPLTGFAIATTNPAGKRFRFEFTLEAVEHLAGQGAQQLISDGVLQAGDKYYCELVLEDDGPADGPAMGTTAEAPGVSVTAAPPRLRYLPVRLPPLLERAEARGAVTDDNWLPVFYTARGFEQAERFARRGGNRQPPVETGAMLVGWACSCPQTGEFYVVVTDAWEAQDADSQQFSLQYSGKTWTRLATILTARQAQPGSSALRFVGQSHGHCFLPLGGAPPCEVCDRLPADQCGRHTCFVSLDDVLWSRAVFTRQPFQLCHIFGLNARGDPVQRLFGRRNGQLLERGFWIIPEFEPDGLLKEDP